MNRLNIFIVSLVTLISIQLPLFAVDGKKDVISTPEIPAELKVELLNSIKNVFGRVDVVEIICHNWHENNSVAEMTVFFDLQQIRTNLICKNSLRVYYIKENHALSDRMNKILPRPENDQWVRVENFILEKIPGKRYIYIFQRGYYLKAIETSYAIEDHEYMALSEFIQRKDIEVKIAGVPIHMIPHYIESISYSPNQGYYMVEVENSRHSIKIFLKEDTFSVHEMGDM